MTTTKTKKIFETFKQFNDSWHDYCKETKEITFEDFVSDVLRYNATETKIILKNKEKYFAK